MADVRVDLVTPSGMMLQGTVLPDEMTVADAVAELVRELRLPMESGTGRLISYRLDLARYGPCPPGATLREAGVANGARLHLVPVQRRRRRRTSASSPAPEAVDAPLAGGAAGMSVQLVLLDRSRVEAARLDMKRPVGELMRQVVERYDLPRRDELGEAVSYRIESQLLGRFLADRETLEAAGISPGDRLVIHRQEHAG